MDANPDIITFRKLHNQMLQEARQEIKKEECLFCHKQVASFCNSHSIPRFVLKNIANSGKLHCFGTFVQLPGVKTDVGVNQAGTFRLLCNECDSQIFSDYENPEILRLRPTNQMMTQMALKDYLRYIYKNEIDIPLYKRIENVGGAIPVHAHEANSLNVRDYMDGFQRCKNMLTKKGTSQYRLVYHQELPYVTPLAFQGFITLLADILKNPINDIFDYSPKVRLESIHMAVFPMKETTAVMLFVHKNDTKYNRFCSQFSRLGTDQKMKYLNFIIFRYTEDYYLAITPFISKMADQRFLSLCEKDHLTGCNPITGEVDPAGKRYLYETAYAEIDDIPNFLSEQYKLR